MDILITIISGTTVYVLGQFILKMIIEPVQDVKKEIQQALGDCLYYAGFATNMPHIKEEYIKEASLTLKKRATQLRSKYAIIPFKDLFEKVKILPSQQDMSEASSILIGIANLTVTNGDFVNNRQNHEWLKEIEGLLNHHSAGETK